MQHILHSVVITASFCIVLLGLMECWTDQQVKNIYDEETSEFIQKGRHLKEVEDKESFEFFHKERQLKKGKCSEKEVSKIFGCMDEDGNGELTIIEVLDRKKCAPRQGFNAVEVFECIDNGRDGIVNLNEATTYACACLGL
mmetsp:Transcript_10203/g.12884  ORF Transcript_10203/g.12884 Transcript_10203/m.12884 type:complete len:141 (-) Transcript_10203:138-560(-)